MTLLAITSIITFLLSYSHHHIPMITFQHYLAIYVITLATLFKNYQVQILAHSVLAPFILTYFIFACSIHFVMFILRQFFSHDLVSFPISFLDVKFLCHCVQLSCQNMYNILAEFDIIQPLRLVIDLSLQLFI